MKKKMVSAMLALTMVLSFVAVNACAEEDHVIKIGAVCAMTGGSAVYGEGALIWQ